MTAPEVDSPLAPTLVEVTYDDVALTVAAVWRPPPGYANFIVSLFKDGSEFAQGSGFGITGKIQLKAPLPIGTGEYVVMVAGIQGGEPGPPSNTMQVITGRLAALSAATEPPRIEAAWAPPEGSELTNGAQLTLLGPSGAALARESLLGTAGALQLAGELEPGSAYKLRARPLFGQSFGPYVELPLVTAPAAIAQMTYEPGAKSQISVVLRPPVPPSALAAVDLLADGVFFKQAKAKGGALVTVELDGPLPPGVAWEVRPYWSAGEARGPDGAAVPVLLDGVAVDRVEVGTSTIEVAWSTYPGPPYPSGAVVRVAPVGGGPGAQVASFDGVTEGSFEPKPPLAAGTAYLLTVAPQRQPSFGPPGPAVPVFAARPPAPGWTRYDGTRLSAGWQASAPTGATGCAMAVLQGGSEIARLALPAAAAGGAVEVPLDAAAGPYAVALQWTAGRSRGPLGPTTAVLAAVPGVSSIAVTEAKVEVTVEPPAATAGIGSYEAVLYRGGDRLAVAHVAAGAKPVAAIAFATGGRAGYEVRVAAASAVQAGTPESSGPASPAVPVPAAPRVTSAVLSGSKLTLAWEPAERPPLASTTVVLTPSSGQPVTFAGQAGTAATLTLPASLLAPGLTVTLQASCVTALGTTPPSAPLKLLTATPELRSARFDGERVSAAWAWPSGAPDAAIATAYRLSLTVGGIVVQSTIVAGSAASLTPGMALGPTAAAALRIDALAGPVEALAGTGSAPASLPLITAGVRTTAVGAAGGHPVKIAWTPEAGGPAPTGFVPVVAWEGGELELPPLPASPTSAEVTLPASVPAGAAIGVRAVAGTATGPLANLAPVLGGAPQGLFLAYANGTLRASWTPPVDGRLSGALLTLKTGGTPTVIPVAGSSWSAAVAAGSAATVAVAATAGDGTGPSAGPLAAILAAPTIEQCSFDGSLLQVSWSASVPAGADRWSVVARHRDQVVATATVTKAAATLALPIQSLPFTALGDLTVTVAALGPGVEGPPSAPLDVLAIAPRVTAAVTDPLTGVTTVEWAAVNTSPAATYAVFRYLDGVQVERQETSATSFALPALEPERELEVAVAALAPAGSKEGPPGPRFRLPTVAPVVESVSFDGATATVRWQGVGGASGYAIDVFGSPATSIGSATAGPGAHEAPVKVTGGSRQAGRQVSVRALFGPSSGPRGLAPLFSPGLYLGAGEPLRLQRASSEAFAAAEPQVAYLPPSGIDLTKLPLEPVQPNTSPATKPFVLAANADAATKEAFPCKLTIANGALVFDATRATLRETFLKLLSEAEQTAGAQPWGLFAIQAAVARLMPQTFEETLLYAYGLNLETGCVDLAPGMVLRVAFAEFDAVPTGAPAAAGGYAGGAVVDYEVGDYFSGASWLVGFDAFLAWLAGNSVIEVPAPLPGSAPPGPDFAESGAAEAADLFFAGFRTAFHRLFVPRNLLSPNAATSVRTKDQFTLVAATKFADLQQAGTAPLPGKTAVAYFRGRTVAKPSLRITVDGEQRVVPIGTTVGNVLDGLGRRAPATKAALRGIALERAPGPVVTDPTRPYDAGAAEPVGLDWEGLRVSAGPRGTLSLPLLHGDRLTLAG